MLSLRSTRDARSAGGKLNSISVTSVSTSAKRSTFMSSVMFVARGTAVRSTERSKVSAIHAMPMPSTAAPMASAALSVSICRTSRHALGAERRAHRHFAGRACRRERAGGWRRWRRRSTSGSRPRRRATGWPSAPRRTPRLSRAPQTRRTSSARDTDPLSSASGSATCSSAFAPSIDTPGFRRAAA